MFLRSFCQTDHLGIDADRFSQVDFVKGVWECAVEGWDFREEGRQALVSDGKREDERAMYLMHIPGWVLAGWPWRWVVLMNDCWN
ncbi:hypothetical protein BBD39_09215 [Arsenophonus endosymbiont of Bemisia tabaci Asia II 3]|nr:hypothetical protein BBD39_09215 [Arsenophonus endosymbiont of Bemisia tabaci Asia II 3]